MIAGLVITVQTAGAAELSDVVLTLEASNGRSQGYVEFTQADGWWEGETFYWQTDQDIPIVDPDSGEVIGTFLSDAAACSYVVPEDGVRSHPQVNLGFAMSAGETATAFTMRSALLSFPSICCPELRASGSINVTDVTGDGAQLDGMGPTGGACLAQYNGPVPNGTTFIEAISHIDALPFHTETGEFDSGWMTIADTMSDMSLQISFTLSAGDSASGTSTLQEIPEPTAMLLALAGLVLIRRRR
jgi:MYXO-CTERM domain-containing protein